MEKEILEYVPNRWKSNPTLMNLIELKYTGVFSDTLLTIKEALKTLKYFGKEDQLFHDYIHESLLDLLQYHNISYIEKSEMTDPAFDYFKVKPDFITNNVKIINIAVDGDIHRFEKQKEMFEIINITHNNFENSLIKIGFGSTLSKYFQSSFKIFKMKIDFWIMCMSLEIIYDNYTKPITLDSNEDPQKHSKYYDNIVFFLNELKL